MNIITMTRLVQVFDHVHDIQQTHQIINQNKWIIAHLDKWFWIPLMYMDASELTRSTRGYTKTMFGLRLLTCKLRIVSCSRQFVFLYPQMQIPQQDATVLCFKYSEKCNSIDMDTIVWILYIHLFYLYTTEVLMQTQ